MDQYDVEGSVRLNVLIERLYEFDSIMTPAVRKDVIGGLVSVGEPAVECLINALESGHIEVQKRASRLFKNLENESELILVLDSSSRMDLSLGSIKRRDVAKKLKDWVSNVRSSAAHALGGIGDRRAVEPLIKAIEDNDPNLRASAAFALGEIGDARVVKFLIETLDDEEKDIRVNTARALGKMGDSRAIEPLIKELSNGDSDFQEEAQRALKSLCDPVTTIVFGQSVPEDELRTIFKDPEVSDLTMPLQSLNKIIIHMSAFDFRKIERFVTYALNHIGREHLKNNVEVYIHGDCKKLPPNLRNLFEGLFKNVKEI